MWRGYAACVPRALGLWSVLPSQQGHVCSLSDMGTPALLLGCGGGSETGCVDTVEAEPPVVFR